MIALRRRLYRERPGYHLIASSETDPRWLTEVPADEFAGHPEHGTASAVALLTHSARPA